jgi:hypothetical protein
MKPKIPCFGQCALDFGDTTYFMGNSDQAKEMATLTRGPTKGTVGI